MNEHSYSDDKEKALAIKYGLRKRPGPPENVLERELEVQLNDPGYTPNFWRVEWLAEYSEFVRGVPPGGLDSTFASLCGPRRTFGTPDLGIRSEWGPAHEVVRLCAGLAAEEISRPVLLAYLPEVKALQTGFAVADRELLDISGHLDCDMRPLIHHIPIPMGDSPLKYARALIWETLSLNAFKYKRGGVVCDRCHFPGSSEHVDSDDRKRVLRDDPVFVVSVGMVHIVIAVCERHGEMLREECIEAGVELAEAPPVLRI